MKDIIYLRVSRKKVEGMTKSLPSLYSGEIPVKLTISVAEKAFHEPVIEQEVTVDDWDSDIDIKDVNFAKSIITKDEAEKIREMRLQRMKEVLEGQGFTVTKEPKQ